MIKSSMIKNSALRTTICMLCAFGLVFSSNGYARPFFGRTLQLPMQKLAAGTGQILIDFKLPANHEFAEEAPSTLFMRTKHSQVLKTNQTKPVALNLAQLPAIIATSSSLGETVAVIDARVHFCDEVSKVCLSDFIRIKFPVQIEADSPAQLRLRIPLKSKLDA